jgi:N-acetylmuramoyl-L-alanine amidase
MIISNLHIKKIQILFLVLFFISCTAQSFPFHAFPGYKIQISNAILDLENSPGRKVNIIDSTTVRSEKKSFEKGITVATNSLFGEKYKDVTVNSSELKGAVYYLVSGHGGPDPGAMAKYGNNILCEDEYAYDITLRLARNLTEFGATVYMITRDRNDGIRDEAFLKPDKDEVCYPNLIIPLNQVLRLRQRKDAINKLYFQHKNDYQRMIEIHIDSRSSDENIDVFFYYDERSKTGYNAARTLLNTFDQKYDEKQPGRGYHGSISTRNLFMVNSTYPPAVYIELGNINHARDQKRFIVTDNRQAVANWLRDGLIKDFENNK